MKQSQLALLGGPRTIDDGYPLKSAWARKGLSEALSEYTGAEYVQCVSSGTAALISSLFAAGGLGRPPLSTAAKVNTFFLKAPKQNITRPVLELEHLCCRATQNLGRGPLGQSGVKVPQFHESPGHLIQSFQAIPERTKSLTLLGGSHGIGVLRSLIENRRIDRVHVREGARLAAFALLHVSSGVVADPTQPFPELALGRPTVAPPVSTDPPKELLYTVFQDILPHSRPPDPVFGEPFQA